MYSYNHNGICRGHRHIIKTLKLYQNIIFPCIVNSSREFITMETEATEEGGMVKRMLLNDNKAGMEGLDKERINQVIHEASKGSKFYENERLKEEQMKRRIEEQKRKVMSISEEELQHGVVKADELLEVLEKQRDLGRTIVHIDMDAFYAAVEMRDKPELREKPMAVGGNAMLSTSNYHARKFGVRAAMPGFIAKKLCPDLVIVPLNFDKYTAVSKQVRKIFADYDPNFCPMSLDEAYLDITDHLTCRAHLSVAKRSYLCRDSNIADFSNCCGCDLNEVIRRYGFNAIEQADRNSLNLSTFFSELVANCDELVDNRMTEKVIESQKVTEEIYDNDQKEMDNTHFLQIDGNAREVTSACPQCHKEFPPFTLKTFGLSDLDAVNELRTRIEQKTQLTASAGIAPNMMLAKVCSDKNKPNGQYKIPASKLHVMEFIRDLPTRKISGIGKVSEAMLNAVNVYTCTDLYEKRGLLYHLYSPISFNYFMRICLGIGSTAVERDSERKSISTERTFSEINKPAELYQKCEELSECLAADMKEEQLKGKTVSIKIKTVKFEVRTRAQTLREHTNNKETIYRAARDLLRTEIQLYAPHPLRLRLMGVRMSSLLPENQCKRQNTIVGAFQRASEKAGARTFTNTLAVTKPSDRHDVLLDSEICDHSYDQAALEAGTIATSDGVVGKIEVSEIDNQSRTKVDISDECKLDPEQLTSKNGIHNLQDSACLNDKAEKLLSSDSVAKPCDSTTENIKSHDRIDTRQNRSGLVRTPVSHKNRKGRNTKSKKLIVYDCPICGQQISCISLAEFNEHVDQCLEAPVGTDNTAAVIAELPVIGNGIDLPNSVPNCSSLCAMNNKSKTLSDALKEDHEKDDASDGISDKVLELTNEKYDSVLDASMDKYYNVPGAPMHKPDNVLGAPMDKSDNVLGTTKCDSYKNVCVEESECNKVISAIIDEPGEVCEATIEASNHATARYECHNLFYIPEKESSDSLAASLKNNDNDLAICEADVNDKDGTWQYHIMKSKQVDVSNVSMMENHFSRPSVNGCETGKVMKERANEFLSIQIVDSANDKCVNVLRSSTVGSKSEPMNEKLGIGVPSKNQSEAEREFLNVHIELKSTSENLGNTIQSCNSGKSSNKKATSEDQADRGYDKKEKLTHDDVSAILTVDDFPLIACCVKSSGDLHDGNDQLVLKYTSSDVNHNNIGGGSVAADYTGKVNTNPVNPIIPAYEPLDYEIDSEALDVMSGTVEEEDESLLVCPICNVEQRAADLNEFNSHVDMCLSRGTIKEILREQRVAENSSLKRSCTFGPSPSSSQSAKRRKTAVPSKKPLCRSIASFFQEK